MNRYIRYWIIFFVFTLSIFWFDYSVSQENISPRTAASGGILGLVNEPFSIYLNPAGISGVEDFYFAAGTNILEKTGYPSFFMGAIFPVGKDLIFGAGWKHFYKERVDIFETEYKLDRFFSSKNKTDENEFFYTLSKSLSSKSSIGMILNFKNRFIERDSVYYSKDAYIKQTLNSSTNLKNISLQIGLQYQIHPKIRLGFLSGDLFGIIWQKLKINDDVYNISDFYSSMDRKFTYTFAKMGIAYFVSPNLTFLSDFSFINDTEDEDYLQTGGLEYSYNDMFFFRVSSKVNYSNNTDIFKNIIGGLGLKYKGFRLDYSFNQYGQYQFGLAYSPELINKFIKIVQVEKVSDNIFPMLREKYANSPIAFVNVFNSSDKDAQIKAVLEIEKYLDTKNETDYVIVPPKQMKSIPVYAYFNEKINEVNNIELNEGTIKIYSVDRGSYQDKSKIRFVYHEKHNWNGNADDLKYYLTPGKPEIVQYFRNILNEESDFLEDAEDKLQKFFQAKILFNEFSKYISYINDPESQNTKTDKVQFPIETINLKSGDCEDLVILYSSMLNSVGISTAFVDINQSDSIGSYAHIYMLFDTEVQENDRNLVSTNEKRYIIRKSKTGYNTVWLPIETTLVSKGFNKAWETGALKFYQDYNIKLGKLKDWMKIIDVNIK
ncbi:hypothetical protein ACFL4T_00035 [candidate division KSB1 bacterium]